MVKESILFVAATSLLIYFVMPAEEPPKIEAAPEEPQMPVIQNTQPADNSWGYEESDDEEEPFTFGQPLGGSVSDNVEEAPSQQERGDPNQGEQRDSDDPSRFERPPR